MLRLSHLIRTEEHDAFTSRFPSRRIADVSIELHDGRRFDSGPTQALGDPERPLGADRVRQKFRRFAEGVCEPGRTQELEQRVNELGANDAGIAPFLDLILGEIRI